MLTLINQYRAENGLPAWTSSQTLGAAAEHHSIDMATKNVFSHTLSDGTTWSKNVSNHGYTYLTYRGENIAAGNSDPVKTLNQWKNSSVHNALLLSRSYKAAGIGFYSYAGSNYTNYWTLDVGGVTDAAAKTC